MSSGNGKAGGGGAGGDYLYDVFLSYSYKPDVRDWVAKKFLPNFRDPLYNALVALSNARYPPPPVEVARVYDARQNMRPGDVWPDELRQALQRSRVLLAICSPPYFVSGWCVSEWQAFKNRGQNLIVPVIYDDTEDFLLDPNRIGTIQHDDFREFMDTSPTAAGFRARVRALARVVAARVLAAPPYNPPGVPPAAVPSSTPNVSLLTLNLPQ
jgi:hypothetical protein